MIGRLWYPQLDVYDTIRRLGGLLSLWQQDAAPSPERLCIVDFYLANAPLLHKTHMPQEVRKNFGDLKVQRPEKTFVRYPSPPLLFQKMDEVQRQAFRTLTGKGLIELSQLDNGEVKPSKDGATVFTEQFLSLFSEGELRVSKFLVDDFAPSSRTISAIRQSTGLRRLVR